MCVDRPATVCDAVVEDGLLQDMVLREDRRSHQPARFALGRQHAEPSEGPVLRAVIAVVFDVIPDAEETGEQLGELTDGLGQFELADDNYSIGLALQQIASYIRTGDPLPESFAVPIVRETCSRSRPPAATLKRQ